MAAWSVIEQPSKPSIATTAATSKDARSTKTARNAPTSISSTRRGYTCWMVGVACTHTPTCRSLGLKGVWLDDERNLLLDSEHGIGAVSDVDLDALIERFCDASGQSLEDEVVEDVLEASPGGLDTGIFLRWEGKSLPIERIERGMVAERFGFVAQPLDVGNKTSTSD